MVAQELHHLLLALEKSQLLHAYGVTHGDPVGVHLFEALQEVRRDRGEFFKGRHVGLS
jgi:hypothetical protein